MTHSALTPPPPEKLATAESERTLSLSVAWAAIISSTIYVISDVIELAQGGFTPFRLSLTLVAEALIPLFVLGLYAIQRPRISGLGLAGAVAFSYAYIFFTGTVLYALTAHTADWSALRQTFGIWLTLHGIVMVVGGLAFGAATIRAAVLPPWTGALLMVGVVLVGALSAMSTAPRLFAEAVVAVSFAGMGFAVIRGSHRSGNVSRSNR